MNLLFVIKYIINQKKGSSFAFSQLSKLKGWEKSNHYFLLVLKSSCIDVKVKNQISLLIFKIYKYVFFSNHHFLRALKFPELREANISISKSRSLNFPPNDTKAFRKGSHSYRQNQQIWIYCNIWGETLKISKLKNTHFKQVT